MPMTMKIAFLWAITAALAVFSLALIFGAIHITGTVPWWVVGIALLANLGIVITR
jgi:ABC-type multidrug transport system permease subunit